MKARRSNLAKPRTGKAEEEMNARIKAIGERERAKRSAREDDLVIRHDPSIVRSRP